MTKLKGFNPLPARRPGATWRSVALFSRRPCFNPLPARRPGATTHNMRCFERLLFQSSPSPKAGSYIIILHIKILGKCFNPLPARRPGATL